MLKKWKLIKTENIFTSKYLGADKSAYMLPSGKIIDDWYTFTRGDFVLVVAINSKGEILIEKQYRAGADEFFFELPAGWIDEGETPIKAGMRELNEETGYSGSGEAYGPFYVLPGVSKVCSYVAILKIDENSQGGLKRDDDENIELSFMSIEEINEMILSGEIKDEGLLVGISVLNALK